METRILMLCQYYTMTAQFYTNIDGSSALQFNKYICGFRECIRNGFFRALNYIYASEI